MTESARNTPWLWLEARAALRVLADRRVTWLVVASMSACAALAALERRADSAFALDRALLGATFGVVVPIACFALTRLFVPGTLAEAAGDAALYGVSRRRLLLGRIAVLLGAEALLGVLLAFVSVAIAAPTERWLPEVLVLAWVAPLAASTHGALLLFGIGWGRHGAVLALLGDWMFGSFAGLLALPWPRAHVRNLLGGEAPFELERLHSTLALWALLLLCVMGASRRTPP